MDWVQGVYLSVISFIFFAIVFLSVCTTKKKEKYSHFIDKIGGIINAISFVVYVILSVIFILGSIDSLFSSSGRSYSTTKLEDFKYYLQIGLFLAFPTISMISVTLSVIFRRKGFSLQAFLIQFLPFLIFLPMAF